MSPPRSYVGLDTGKDLTLLAFWAARPGETLESLDRSWPVRVQTHSFRATTAAATEDISRIVRELCDRAGGNSKESLLVRMGETTLLRACEIAAHLGMLGIIEPLQRLVLSTGGVLPAQEVREYTRPVPPTEAVALDSIRSGFAELMEEAARDLQALGLDQDDSLLDHLVDVRCSGQPDVLTVPVESLTDLARFLRPIRAEAGLRAGVADPVTPIEVLTARIRCIITTARMPAGGPVEQTSQAGSPGWTRHPIDNGHTLWTPSGQA
jgi:N-methylhydantoinase A/oxoprolinase/acetone carboxylase beta subunit